MTGGKRKGAGRPRGSYNKERITVRLPPWLKVWLQDQPESQAVLIERALLKYIREK